jgi:hypothetical protein
MNLIEFTDRYQRRVMVNADKVLGLYVNDGPYTPDGINKGLYTFIETGPSGVDGENTGPVVAHTIDEVAAKLKGL